VREGGKEGEIEREKREGGTGDSGELVYLLYFRAPPSLRSCNIYRGVVGTTSFVDPVISFISRTISGSMFPVFVCVCTNSKHTHARVLKLWRSTHMSFEHTHTYIHTYVHTYIHTYLLTYILTYRQTDRQT